MQERREETVSLHVDAVQQPPKEDVRVRQEVRLVRKGDLQEGRASVRDKEGGGAGTGETDCDAQGSVQHSHRIGEEVVVPVVPEGEMSEVEIDIVRAGAGRFQNDRGADADAK